MGSKCHSMIDDRFSTECFWVDLSLFLVLFFFPAHGALKWQPNTKSFHARIRSDKNFAHM